MSNKNGLGAVDAFGLDQFGQPVGLNPVWGAALGSGLGTIGAIATRRYAPKYAKHSELVGFGLGAGASAAMLAFEGTRAAGWTGLASAFMNNGLRSLEIMFFHADAAKTAAASAETIERMAQAQAEASNGNGNAVSGITIDPTQVLEGVTIDPTQTLGAAPLPTLVGAGVSGHFGSTVINP